MNRLLAAFCLMLAGLACAADAPSASPPDPAAQLLVMVQIPAEHFRIDATMAAATATAPAARRVASWRPRSPGASA